MDETSQPQPGGRRRAVPLAASSLFLSAAVGGVGLIVQLYLKSLGTPVFLIGLISTLGAAGALLGSWTWGTASDYFKRRRLLAFLTLALGIAISALIVLPSAGIVLPLEFLRSVMSAGVGTVAVAVVSAASLAERRGKNLSYISSARSFGFAAGSIVAGIVLDRMGFRPAFILMALLPVVALLLLGLLPRDNPVARSERISVWKAIFGFGLLDLYVATAFRQMAIFGAFALLYVYMDSLGISASLMGLISSANTATQVLAILIFGWLADRVGRRRIFMLGFLSSAVVPLILAFATTVAGMIGGYVMLAISFSSLYVGSAAHIGDRVPQHRQGQMLGLFESSRGLGGLFGPVLAGAIVPSIGFRGMFLVMAGIGMVGFVVMLLGRTSLGRRMAGA